MLSLLWQIRSSDRNSSVLFPAKYKLESQFRLGNYQIIYNFFLSNCHLLYFCFDFASNFLSGGDAATYTLQLLFSMSCWFLGRQKWPEIPWGLGEFSICVCNIQNIQNSEIVTEYVRCNVTSKYKTPKEIGGFFSYLNLHFKEAVSQYFLAFFFFINPTHLGPGS